MLAEKREKRGKINPVEPAKGCRNLVLLAPLFSAEHPFKVDGILGQILLAPVSSLQGVKSIEHADSKRTAGAKPRTGRQVGIIGQPDRMHIQKPHRLAYRRVFNPGDIGDPFGLRIDNLVGVMEIRWQMPYRDIAVFVERRGNHGTAMFLIKLGDIRSTTKERHAERSLGNDHARSSFPPVYRPVLPRSKASDGMLHINIRLYHNSFG